MKRMARYDFPCVYRDPGPVCPFDPGGHPPFPLGFMFVVDCTYFVLGFYIETPSLTVITIPIIDPLVIRQGYDPIWFGILMIVLSEMALTTLRVRLNRYMVQGVRKSGKMIDVMIGAVPCAAAMLMMVAAVFAFPQIALMLPNMLQRP
ncbi:TRAP transporter large permease subunit [uncultured Sulfitobacter sp.]|uniref:TRAP transporter large permease subunit n=1 Tax=uncultured Sulfitobacter sp. TaxID=191468 RepID=UPI00344E5AD2